MGCWIVGGGRPAIVVVVMMVDSLGIELKLEMGLKRRSR